MTLIPTHSLAKQRQAVFVGRKPEIARFLSVVDDPDRRSDHCVLSLYGEGGQGKSALLSEMRVALTQRGGDGSASALVDFSDVTMRDAESTLTQIRHQFQRAGITTPAFDVAFARVFAISNPGKDMRQVHPEFFERKTGALGDLVDVLFSVAGEVPGGKLISNTLIDASGKVKDWYRKETHKILSGIESKTISMLRHDLPMYLGYDLCTACAEEKLRQPIIYLDGYEMLGSGGSTSGSNTTASADEWVRRLVEECPGILFVIAGRRRVDWSRYDADWSRVICPVPLQQLEEAEAQELLQLLSVHEDDLRTHFVALANGHPLSLHLLASIREKLVHQGNHPKVDDFPKRRSEVIDRYFSHLDRSSLAVIRALAVPGRFMPQVWDTFSRGGFSAFELCSPAEILKEAFFSTSSDGYISMHEGVRDAAIDSLRNEDVAMLKRVQLFTVEQYEKIAGVDREYKHNEQVLAQVFVASARDAILGEAARLLKEVDQRLFVDWAIKTLGRLEFRGGSNLRDSWINEIQAYVAENEESAPILLPHLSRLQFQTDPFAHSTLERISSVARMLGDKSANLQAVDALRGAMWHASQVRGARLPLVSDLLRPFVSKVDCVQWPVLDYRLALTMGDQATLIAVLDKAIATRKCETNWDLLAAVTSLNEGLSRQFIRRIADLELQKLDPLSALDDFLMLNRPRLGIEFLEHLFSVEADALVTYLVDGFKNARAGTARHQGILLVVECMLKTGDLARAKKLLLAAIPEQGFNILMAHINSEGEDGEVGSPPSYPWVNDFEKEFGIIGLSQGYARAWLSLGQNTEGHGNCNNMGKFERFLHTMQDLESGLDFKLPTCGVDSIAVSRTLNVELGCLPNGGLALVTDSALFGNRTCDYFHWEAERNRICFQDLRRGHGRFLLLRDEVRSLFGQGAAIICVYPSVTTGKAIGVEKALYESPPVS